MTAPREYPGLYWAFASNRLTGLQARRLRRLAPYKRWSLNAAWKAGAALALIGDPLPPTAPELLSSLGWAAMRRGYREERARHSRGRKGRK